MNISESKLRQIVLKEVAEQYFEHIIEEEFNKFLLETDADLEAYKASKKRALISKIKKGALSMAVGGALLGMLNQQTTDYADIKAGERAALQQLNIEKKSTIENSVEDLNKQAGNFFAWTWKTNDAQTLPFPANPDHPGEAILPPEWSVVAQVAKDKAAGTPQYEVDQNYLNTAMSPQALSAMYKDIEGSPPPGSADGFFDDFAPESHPFSDASEMGAHAFMSNNPGIPSAMLDIDDDGAPDTQNLVYIPFDELPDGYTMPNSGLTKEQMYKQYYYGHGMSFEEFNNLKGEIEPSPDTELNPELIQKTMQRIDRLRESRVTWRNYKNRKKMLA